MATQRITFTEWTPDLPGVAENLSIAKNVIPNAIGYAPFPLAVDYSNSASENLNNVCAGRFNTTTNIFAGGETKLFRFDGSTLNLTNVSKSVARTITNVGLAANVATITTNAAHGYSPDDSVIVDASNNTFDGTYNITSTPTATTFTYAKAFSTVKEISNVLLAANVATITTSVVHGYTTGDYVTVNATNDVFDGSYVVISAPTTTTFTYARTYSTSKDITTVSLTSNVATVTTSVAHNYLTGDYITVDCSNNVFDGSYVITGTPTTTTFTYARTNANIASVAATGTTFIGIASVAATGTTFKGIAPASATGTVIAEDYSAVDKWNFAQYGNTILAANNRNKLQSYTLGTSTYFGDVSPNAPVAEYVAIVRDFVVTANLDGGVNSNIVRWSDINDESDWVSGYTSQSDFQIIPDGGNIHGITGGEVGLILLDRSIVRMSYIGSPFFFQFDTISHNQGCIEGNSVVKYGNITYFLGDDGFYSCDGSSVTAIGTQKVDAWFYANANPAKFDLMSSTVDPVRKIVVWSFIDNFAVQTLLIYNWQIQKWSYCTTDANFVSSTASSGSTLEGLNTNYLVNAGSFVIGNQYTIAAIGSTDFTLIGAELNIVGVRFTATGAGTGTGNAIDLAAAAAENRTLDTLTTSLDDNLWAGGKLLFAGARGDKVITFSGAHSPAQITTGDIGNESTSVVTLARPIVDNGSGSVAIVSRTLLNQVPEIGSYTAADGENRVSLRSSGKYHRLSLIPTGDNWSNAIGIDIDVSPQGTR
jgi:hypothetical protein